jgi:hypothetical protein
MASIFQIQQAVAFHSQKNKFSILRNIAHCGMLHIPLAVIPNKRYIFRNLYINPKAM